MNHKFSVLRCTVAVPADGVGVPCVCGTFYEYDGVKAYKVGVGDEPEASVVHCATRIAESVLLDWEAVLALLRLTLSSSDIEETGFDEGDLDDLPF